MNKQRFAYKTGAFFCAALMILSSCALATSDDAGSKPEAGYAAAGSGKATVMLNIAGSNARTALPTAEGVVSKYALTMTHSTAEAISKDIDFGSGALVLDIAPGTWTFNATGYTADGVPVTQGTTVKAFEENEIVKLTITMNFLSTEAGIGSVSLPVRFPGDEGIDYLSAQLSQNGAAVGDPITPAIPAPGTDGTITATIAASDIPSGNYEMKVLFKRGGSAGTTALVLDEGVNVRDSVATNRWFINGILVETLNLESGDFDSSDASLSDIILTLNTGTAYGYEFAPPLTVYGFSLNEPFSVTPKAAEYSSDISYSWNGGDSVPIASGTTSATLTPTAGRDSLIITVTAPDRQTTKTYEYYLETPPAAPSITPGSGKLPTGNVVFEMTAEAGAEIRYTLDGSLPTNTSTLYTGALTLALADEPILLKAVAVVEGQPSAVRSSSVYPESEAIIKSFDDPAQTPASLGFTGNWTIDNGRLRSGTIGSYYATTTSTYKATLSGAHTISFKYGGWTEKGYDLLRVYINNIEQTLSPDSGNGFEGTFKGTLPSGPIAVDFTYFIAGTEVIEPDYVWIDDLVITPIP